MFELNDDTKTILGRLNFMCGPMAVMLREDGHDIQFNSEAEQGEDVLGIRKYETKLMHAPVEVASNDENI